MKKQRGFTLIELLAVVVILAVIALISVPLIMNVIDGARKGALQNTAYGIAEAGKYAFTSEVIKDGSASFTAYTYENGVETSSPSGKNLNYKGEKPQAGTILINSKGDIAISIYNGKYCAEKDYDDLEVTVSQKTQQECQNSTIIKSVVEDGLILSLDGRDFINNPTTTSWLDKSSVTGNATPASFGYTITSGSDEAGGVVFDGINDYVYTPAIAINASMTWEAIVKSSVAKAMFVLDNRQAGVGVQPIYLDANGSMQFYDSVIGSLNTPTNTFKFDGQPHHIVSVATATSKKMYYDGQLVASVATGITPVTARPMYIGTRYTNTVYLAGTVLETRVYNRALTETEILQNYNAYR